MSRYFPMVVPPLPWIAYDTGGHLTLRCLVMRTRGDRQQLKLLQQADEEMINGGPGMGQVRGGVGGKRARLGGSGSSKREAVEREGGGANPRREGRWELRAFIMLKVARVANGRARSNARATEPPEPAR